MLGPRQNRGLSRFVLQELDGALRRAARLCAGAGANQTSPGSLGVGGDGAENLGAGSMRAGEGMGCSGWRGSGSGKTSRKCAVMPKSTDTESARDLPR